MQIGRRSFLGNGLALFGSVAAKTQTGFGQSKPNRGQPRLKIGVIADPHIGTEWMMGINSPATEKAFRDFRAQDVDAVAVLGDITNSGKISQLEEFARIWYEVFPEEKTEIVEEFYATRAGSFQAPVATIVCEYAPHYRANDAWGGRLEISAE